jgi:outer membrane protein
VGRSKIRIEEFFAVKHFVVVCLALGAAAIAAAQAPATPTAPATPVSAPGAGPTRVGVINIQAAITTTKDGQKAAAELEERFTSKRKDMEKKQQEIKELQEKLQRGGNTLSQTAKDDTQRAIDQKTRSFNYDMQDAQSEYETEQRKVIDELGQKLMQVIDKYAVSNGLAVVLDVSNQNTPVLYASNSVDITKDIIEMYDKVSSTLVATPRPTAAPKPTGPAPRPAAPKPVAPPKQ